jgi:hypothetical protein
MSEKEKKKRVLTLEKLVPPIMRQTKLKLQCSDGKVFEISHEEAIMSSTLWMLLQGMCVVCIYYVYVYIHMSHPMYNV